MGGKTGTSEKIDTYDENGKPVEDKIVSFIGVAPIDDPKYVVLVALDTPNYVAGTSYTPHNQYISGGLMAAPTVRDVFLDILPYLGVEPDYSSDDIRGVNITLPDVIGMTEDEAAALLSGKIHHLPHGRSGQYRLRPAPEPGRGGSRQFRDHSLFRKRRQDNRTGRGSGLCGLRHCGRGLSGNQRGALYPGERAPTTATNMSRLPIRTSSPEQWLTEGLQNRIYNRRSIGLTPGKQDNERSAAHEAGGTSERN